MAEFDFHEDDEYQRRRRPSMQSRADDGYDDFGDFEGRGSRRRSREMPHSGWGVASTCVAIAAGLMAAVGVVAAGVLMADAGGELDENSGGAMASGCVILLSIGLAFFGMLMGLAGVVLPERKKLFGV